MKAGNELSPTSARRRSMERMEMIKMTPDSKSRQDPEGLDFFKFSQFFFNK